MRLGVGLLGFALAASGCSTSAPGSAATGTGSSGPPSAAASLAVATPAGPPAASASALATGGPSPTASEVAVKRSTPFTMTSTAFHDGAAIPSRYTCDGEDRSPDLAWSGAPARTVALALIARDPDAHDFVHWIAYDLTGAPDGRLPAGVAPSADSPRQGRNDFGKRGYGGPCPPSGEHRYRFTLYALDRPLGIGDTPRLAEVEAAMKGHVLAQTTLTGTYRRH